MVQFIILLNGYNKSHKVSVNLGHSRIFKALNIAVLRNLPSVLIKKHESILFNQNNEQRPWKQILKKM